MSGWDESSDRDVELLARAMRVCADVEAFNARWPDLPQSDSLPGVSWEALERQLVELAASELQAELVRGLLQRIREYARLKPPEMVLREVLGVAAFVLEDAASLVS